MKPKPILAILVAFLATAALLRPEAPTQPAAGRALTLIVSSTCPGSLSWSISGATPFGRVVLVGAWRAGSTVVTGGPCAGLVLGLDSPARIVWRAGAGALGGVGGGISPLNTCDFYLQAVDVATCTASNVEYVP